MATERVKIVVTETGARKVSGAIKGIGSTAFSAGKKVAKFTALVALVGTGFAIKKAADFETSMLSVAKTTGIVGLELDKLSSTFLEMSKVIPLSAAELAEIGAVAGQLSIRGAANIASFTDTAAKMAAVTRFSAEGAAQALAELSNVFKLPIAESKNLGSALNEVANTTTATAPILVNFAQRMGVIGRQVGLTAADIIGLAGTLKGLGFRAELASTAINKTFVAMITDADKFAEQTGVSFAQFKENMERDAIGTTIQWAEAINKLPRDELIAALEDVGLTGARAVPVILALSGGTADLKRNVETANKAFAEGTSLQKEFDIQVKSTTNQFKLLLGKVNALAIGLGTDLLPTVKKVIEQFSEFFDSTEVTLFFENLKDAFRSTADSIDNDSNFIIASMKDVTTAVTTMVNFSRKSFNAMRISMLEVIQTGLEMEEEFTKIGLAFDKFQAFVGLGSRANDAQIRAAQASLVGLQDIISGVQVDINLLVDANDDIDKSFAELQKRIRGASKDLAGLGKDLNIVGGDLGAAARESAKYDKKMQGVASTSKAVRDKLKELADETARVALGNDALREFSDILKEIGTAKLGDTGVEQLQEAFDKLQGAKFADQKKQLEKDLQLELINAGELEESVRTANSIFAAFGDVEISDKFKNSVRDTLKQISEVNKAMAVQRKAFEDAIEIRERQAIVTNDMTSKEQDLAVELQRLADIAEITGGKLFDLGVAQENVIKKFAETTTDVVKKTSDETKQVLDAIGKGTEDILTEVITTGKITFESLGDIANAVAEDIIRAFIRAQIQAAITRAITVGDAGGGLGEVIGAVFGFAGGGRGIVQGGGGVDSTRVSFLATPGERVTVETPQQASAGAFFAGSFGGGGQFNVPGQGGNGGDTTIINAPVTVITQDLPSFRKSKGQIAKEQSRELARARRFE